MVLHIYTLEMPPTESLQRSGDRAIEVTSEQDLGSDRYQVFN